MGNANLINDIINYWLDKGIDGFRMDVEPRERCQQGYISGWSFFEKFEEMYEACFKSRDIMTVGEMGGISVTRAQAITSKANLG